MSNGLFQVKINKYNQESLFTEKTESIASQWHRKLIHASYGSMKKMLAITEGMNLLSSDLEVLKSSCEICQMAKQPRLSFGKIRTRATRALKIIHTDLYGPIDSSTWNKKKYFMTFLDDYTHYTMAFLLESKYEMNDVLKEYVQRVEAHWNTRVYKIRCDNGKEYLNKDIQTWCKRKGIVLDNTIPYTPQLNGKVQRLNKTLLDKVRALLFDSGFDKNMWGEALYKSVYILNRTSTNVLQTTPYEMWEK